jgi:hypothetical protein
MSGERGRFLVPVPVSTTEPTQIQAGDSLAWDRVLADYPASTWTLKYVLRGPVKVYVTTTADGDTHQIRVPGSTTENWQAGAYRLVGRVTDGTDTYTIHDAPVHVLPDPAMEPDSHTEQLIALLEARELELGGLATVASWTQGDRSETMAKLSEVRGQLNTLRDQLRVERGGSLFVSVRAVG